MLILPPDHPGQTRPGHALSRRERWLVGVMAAVTGLIVLAVVISLAVSGPSSGGGCVHATYPGPVGAEQINACGSSARTLCATLRTSDGYGPEATRTIAAECRKAGLAVGS